jgi:hypothetical protein
MGLASISRPSLLLLSRLDPMKKRNLKEEKAARNIAYSEKFKRYDKESRKKRRAARVKERDARFEHQFWS